MVRRLVPLLMLMLAACGDDPFRDATIPPAGAQANSSTGRRFDPAMMAAARTALDEQPWTTFVQVIDTPSATEWRIGVKGTGQPELGYARITCMILGGHSVVDAATRVWILDDALAKRPGRDEVVKRANLGGLNCETLQELRA